MANLTLSFAAALTFMWAADFKSAVESPRMALVSTLEQNSSTSGILMPGGSWTSRDGVVISAPTGVISTPIEVFAEKVDPVGLPVPLPADFTLVNAPFHVGSNKYSESGNDDVFSIKLPITSGMADANTRVLILIPAYYVDDSPGPGDQLFWFPSGLIDMDAAGKNAIETTSTLSPEGVTYAFVRYTGTVTGCFGIIVCQSPTR
jgi:hypothetical protein